MRHRSYRTLLVVIAMSATLIGATQLHLGRFEDGAEWPSSLRSTASTHDTVALMPVVNRQLGPGSFWSGASVAVIGAAIALALSATRELNMGYAPLIAWPTSLPIGPPMRAPPFPPDDLQGPSMRAASVGIGRPSRRADQAT